METSYLYLPLFLALYIFTKHFLNKIRNLPPSPILNLPVLGHLLLIKKPLYRGLAKISDRHGPVLLLEFGSRPVLLVSSPSAAEECLNKHDIVFANRPRLLAGKHLGNNYTSLSWTSYGDHWRNLRRIASLEILSSHRLQTLHAIRVDEVKLMLKRLFSASENKKSVDMKALFFELMLNVMMRMIAGKRYYGENVGEVEEARRFREIVEETMRIGGASNMGDFWPVLRWLKVGKTEKALRVLQENRDQFVQELIKGFRSAKHAENGGADAEETGEKKKTLIEVLLTLQQKEPEYYKDEIIRSLMLVLLAAGTDTSVGTMEWALSLMLNNPSTLEKAKAEIDRIIGKERLLDESDVANLPYLRCIISE
ncbi:unnamed protein product, partial [Coffea canephora]